MTIGLCPLTIVAENAAAMQTTMRGAIQQPIGTESFPAIVHDSYMVKGEQRNDETAKRRKGRTTMNLDPTTHLTTSNGLIPGGLAWRHVQLHECIDGTLLPQRAVG